MTFTRNDNAPLTLADIEEALGIAARLVELRGEVMLPYFERMEREVQAAQSRTSAIDRAKALAAASRLRLGEPAPS